MRGKIRERYYFFLALLEAIGIIWARTKHTLRDALDVFMALVRLLLDAETLKNKLCAVLMILCTLPVIFLDGDATATVFIGMIAVPMFFARENWIL